MIPMNTTHDNSEPVNHQLDQLVKPSREPKYANLGILVCGVLGCIFGLMALDAHEPYDRQKLPTQNKKISSTEEQFLPRENLLTITLDDYCKNQRTSPQDYTITGIQGGARDLASIPVPPGTESIVGFHYIILENYGLEYQGTAIHKKTLSYQSSSDDSIHSLHGYIDPLMRKEPARRKYELKPN